MLHKKLLYLKQVNESLSSGLLTAGVLTVGFILGRALKEHRNKYVSCKHIVDLYDRNLCMIRVIETTIESMNKYISGECNQTPDPAECKLKIIKKQERLHKQKQNILNRLSRIERAIKDRDMEV